MSKTRKELRRMVGTRLGDYVLLTEDTGGQDTIWRDADKLLGNTNAYRGRYLYPSGGTVANLAAMRRVTSSSQGQVEFSPALPANNAAADEAELWGIHGEGFLPTEVNDILAEVVHDGTANFYVPVQADVTDAFDAFDRQFTVPATITIGIYDVEVQDLNDDWVSVDRASNSGGSGFWVNRGLGYVTVGGDSWLSRMDGMNLRVTGYGTGTPLTTDASTTNINSEWIVYETMSRLLYMGFERNPELSRLKLPMATMKAQENRARARMRPAPDWQRV
jgi:hypothetical protein